MVTILRALGAKESGPRVGNSKGKRVLDAQAKRMSVCVCVCVCVRCFHSFKLP